MDSTLRVRVDQPSASADSQADVLASYSTILKGVSIVAAADSLGTRRLGIGSCLRPRMQRGNFPMRGEGGWGEASVPRDSSRAPISG